MASPAVPLAQAMLCADCAQISAPRGPRCPVCGSAALLALARVLDRPAGGAGAGKEVTRAGETSLAVPPPTA